MLVETKLLKNSSVNVELFGDSVGRVMITSIDTSDNELFQKETYLDCIVGLNTGSSLRIDFKLNRYDSGLPNYPVEFVSNPGGKPDGWGYHEGITIIHFKIDELAGKTPEEPVVYTIDRDFINNVTRNQFYGNFSSPSTDGLYTSRFRSVPRQVLEKYWGV